MKLLKYVLNINLKKQVMLLVLVLITGILNLAPIELGKRIIDVITSPGENVITGYNAFQTIEIYSLLFLMAILLAGILNYYVGILFTIISQETLLKIRRDLYSHVLKLDLNFFTKVSTGDIMSRILMEVQQLGMFLSQIVLTPAQGIATIVISFVYLATLNWKLTLLAMAIISTVFFFLPALAKKLKKLTMEWGTVMREVSGQAQESLSAYFEIQSNGTHLYEEENFISRLKNFFKINVDLAKVNGKTSFLSSFISNLCPIAVYLYGGYLCLKPEPEMTVGMLVAFTAALPKIFTPLRQLIDYSQRFQEASTKFNMVFEYMNIKPEIEDAPDAKKVDKLKGKIDLVNVFFGYNPQKMILKNINMDIKPGEHVALVGPSGCGKSTVSILVNRLMKPVGGEIRIDDLPIHKYQIMTLRERMGYISQNPLLFGESLLENILYALKRKKKSSGDDLYGWVDLESIGIKDPQELIPEIMKILEEIAFLDDVYTFGLRVSISELAKSGEGALKGKNIDDIRKKILKARELFQKKMEQIDKSEGKLIEFFDENKFMELSSVLDNVIFSSGDAYLADPRVFREIQPFVDECLKKAGVYDRVFELGYLTAREIAYIVKRVKRDDSGLLKKLGIQKPDADRFGAIGGKLQTMDAATVQREAPPPVKAAIMNLGYKYTAAHVLDVAIDDDFKDKIIKARKYFMENIPENLKEKIEFYSKDKFSDSASISENIITGKINRFINRANETITEMLRETLEQVGMGKDILEFGLHSHVGERGARLSGGQKQKVSIARVLLKKPDILIMDEATASLDAGSQAKVDKMIAERFKDKTVIAIAHRLSTIKDFDKIYVFRAGEIVEKGNFEELLAKDGLFKKLYEKV